MIQPDLFSRVPLHDGPGLTMDDQRALGRQLEAVKGLMLDGLWRTLLEISVATDEPEASISARLRDLRKPKFGAWTVERRRRMGRLYEYRVTR